MKRLFTPKADTVNIIAGHSAVAGKTYILASVNEPRVANKLAKGEIIALDLEFPDHANHLDYMKYVVSAKGKPNQFKVAGENYLADLEAGKSPADVAAAEAAASIEADAANAAAKKAEAAAKKAEAAEAKKAEAEAKKAEAAAKKAEAESQDKE